MDIPQLCSPVLRTLNSLPAPSYLAKCNLLQEGVTAVEVRFVFASGRPKHSPSLCEIFLPLLSAPDIGFPRMSSCCP